MFLYSLPHVPGFTLGDIMSLCVLWRGDTMVRLGKQWMCWKKCTGKMKEGGIRRRQAEPSGHNASWTLAMGKRGVGRNSLGLHCSCDYCEEVLTWLIGSPRQCLPVEAPSPRKGLAVVLLCSVMAWEQPRVVSAWGCQPALLWTAASPKGRSKSLLFSQELRYNSHT